MHNRDFEISLITIDEKYPIAFKKELARLHVSVQGRDYLLTVLDANPSVGLRFFREKEGGHQFNKQIKIKFNDAEIAIGSPFSITISKDKRVLFSTDTLMGISDPVSISSEGYTFTFPFSINNDEAIYGLGEYFGELNKVGQRLETYIYDAVGLPEDKTYISYPFFWSTKGYGILVNSYKSIIFDFGKTSSGIGKIEIPSESPELYFMLGSPQQIIRAFWELTGFPDLPPVWSFGIWYSVWRSNGYKYSDYKTQGDVMALADKIRNLGLPGDVIHVDPVYTQRPLRESLKKFMRERLGMSEEDVHDMEKIQEEEGRWSYAPVIEALTQKFGDKVGEYVTSGAPATFEWQKGFNDPKALTEYLHQNGFHVSIWVNPYAQKGTKWYDELLKNNALVKVDGAPAVEMPAFTVSGTKIGYNELFDDVGAVDFTSKVGRDMYASKIKELLQLGFDAIKTDYGEGAPHNGEYSVGNGSFLHNLYPLLYNQVVYDAIKQSKGEAVVWGRSGCIGIQKYPIRWGGDVGNGPPDMAKALRGALSLTASGVAFTAFDAGGYGGKPTPESYIRWIEMGLLFSHVRLHGTSEREPWNYGEKALEVFKKFSELRYSLMPYILNSSANGINEGKPLVRPLAFDYPDDRICQNTYDEYMLGDYLLVAPVFSGSSRTIYLPSGTWYNFWSKEAVSGPKTFTVDVPLDSIPIYVKDKAALIYTDSKLSSEKFRDLRVDTYGDVDCVKLNLPGLGRLDLKINGCEQVEINGTRIKLKRAALDRS
ncbi:MAG: TIM-barrel domain-containing protein [Thermoprotei archaeon]